MEGRQRYQNSRTLIAIHKGMVLQKAVHQRRGLGWKRLVIPMKGAAQSRLKTAQIYHSGSTAAPLGKDQVMDVQCRLDIKSSQHRLLTSTQAA